MGLMDISMRPGGLSCDNERQPRFGQLQLRGVDGSGHLAVMTRGDLLESVARCDLRLAAPVHEPPSAGLHRRTRGGALRAQPLEAEPVDRLERQRGLKSLAGCRVEITRGPQSPFAIELRAVALEAEGTGRPRTRRSRGNPTAQGHPVQSLPAGLTQRPRAFAFELPARKANPFMLSNLRSVGR
jgi:hypothetical protein